VTTHHDGGPGRGGARAVATLPAETFVHMPLTGERDPGRLSGRPAVFVLASLVVALLASSAAPTPLYAIYQARWHFTPITTTIVFGVYAVAVLISLLTLGKLSDHVGRRPVLLTALAVHAGSLVIFATASGVPALLSARVVQGLSTGAALGAIGAAMLDMDRERGTFANAVAPGMGSATGAILSALAVRFLPDPTHLIYLALIGVLAVQGIAIAAMRETVSPAPGALASLRPEITLPRALRAPVLTAVPVLFAVWALAGLYGALGPALVHALTGSGNVVLGSLSLFVLAGAAVVAIVALRRAAARTVILTGIAALIAGVAVTIAAVSLGSASVFFIGSAIAGVGFGSGFQGGIRLVVPLAAPHQRAGVVSLLYVVSYLGLGVPAVIAGYGVVHGGGLIDTARYYGAAVITLAVLALAGLLKTRARAGN
jgi:predicted MFS family arabinose efflux permease